MSIANATLEKPLTSAAEDDCDWYIAETALAADEPSPIGNLAALTDGWNGDHSKAPTPGAIGDAEQIAMSTTARHRSVGPTDDGEIVFEWELSSERSVFAHVLPDGFEIVEINAGGDRQWTADSLRDAVSLIQRLIG